METPNPTPRPFEDVEAAQRLAEITGMTREAAKTFLEFHTGMRWLRRDPE
jgi:hypothetical protein